MKIVCTSGYFNPLHTGHLDLIEASKKLGDYLIVIVNNDQQVSLKGSVPMQSQEARLRIVAALRSVDYALLSEDTDKTVCKTLTRLKPDIFAKGGDSTEENIPEQDVCSEFGIKIVLGVGGGKQDSSSKLVWKSPYTDPWKKRTKN